MATLQRFPFLTGRLLAASGILLLGSLSGCASIVSGQNQVVSVETPLCPGAKCRLQNKAGVFWVPMTPGTISINREYDDLIVTCSKDGYPDTTLNVGSSTKGMAFGNILVGGIIGAGVDMATGAAYDYPAVITVPLDCRDATAREAVGNTNTPANTNLTTAEATAPTNTSLENQ